MPRHGREIVVANTPTRGHSSGSFRSLVNAASSVSPAVWSGINREGRRLFEEYTTNKKRKRSKSTPGRSKPSKQISRNVKNEGASGPYQAGAKRIRKNATKEKKVKRVKVTKAFKEKVAKAMLGRSSIGYVKNTFLGDAMYNNTDEQQATFDASGGLQPTYGSITPWHFTLLQIRQMCNQLWADLAPVNTSTGLLATGVGLFPPTTLKVKILKLRSKYLFRNVTKHTQILNIYDVAPKMASAYTPTNSSAASGVNQSLVVVPDAEAFGSALTLWKNSLFVDYNGGFELGRAGLGGSNPTVADIHRSPMSCKTLKKLVKLSLVKVVLEPGQTYEHYLDGPAMTEVDFAKCYRNGVLLDIQKYSRAIMTTVTTALTGASIPAGTSSAFGRFGDLPASGVNSELNQGQAIPVERTDYYQLLMPDETLGSISSNVTGVPVDNTANYRRPVRQENTYGVARPSADPQIDVQEMGPTIFTG